MRAGQTPRRHSCLICSSLDAYGLDHPGDLLDGSGGLHILVAEACIAVTLPLICRPCVV